MGDKFNSSFSMNGQNSVIKRINDTSSSMTWREHQHLGWKEASQCDFSNMSFRGVSFWEQRVCDTRFQQVGCARRGRFLPAFPSCVYFL